VVEASPSDASSYIHSTSYFQPPISSGSPFQTFDSTTNSAIPPFPGRDQKWSSTKYYYIEGEGNNINIDVVPQLPPSTTHSLL